MSAKLLLSCYQVFLRETVKMLLDDALHHALMRHILRIQSWVRCILTRAKYKSMKEAAIAIQVCIQHASEKEMCNCEGDFSGVAEL